jgi:chloramphenicol 3-O-phosphotransferase
VPSPIDTIFLNGTVGSGKTTVAETISAIESVPHALIDLDQIRLLRPTPPEDQFNHELELENLKSLASNYRRAGAKRFILAGVIEKREEIARYRAALDSMSLWVCRLTAKPEILRHRLIVRHEGHPTELQWHLDRSAELEGILDREHAADVVLDTSERSLAEIADLVRDQAGWA